MKTLINFATAATARNFPSAPVQSSLLSSFLDQLMVTKSGLHPGTIKNSFPSLNFLKRRHGLQHRCARKQGCGQNLERKANKEKNGFLDRFQMNMNLSTQKQPKSQKVRNKEALCSSKSLFSLFQQNTGKIYRAETRIVSKRDSRKLREKSTRERESIIMKSFRDEIMLQ